MRILYIDIDSLRPDHLGCYGYNRPTSPCIDALARDGMCFDHYYASDSPCMPSRNALISGRFGINNGCITHDGPNSKLVVDQWTHGGPKPRNQLLPRRIRESGLSTVCFSNFAWRHCSGWFALGWEEFHSPSLDSGEEDASLVNQKVLNWLKAHPGRDDYFLYVNYWDVHRNYTIDPSWADRFHDHPYPKAWPDDDAIQRNLSNKGEYTGTNLFHDGGKSPSELMPDTVRNRKEFEQLVTGYDSTIAYVDHHIQELLNELDRQGVLDETAIIISADHGEALGEHGIYADHTNADESVHRLPLIIRWPGVTPANTRNDAMLYNVDLSATLCAMTHGDIPEHYDGRSFANQLRGDKDWDREYLVWSHGFYTLQRGIRTRENLLLKTYDNRGYPFEPLQLYDMRSDPNMTTNIAQTKPERVRRLQAYYQQWLDEQTAKPNAISDPMVNELIRRRGKT